MLTPFHRLTALGGLVCLAIAAPAAQGQFTLISQARELKGQGLNFPPGLPPVPAPGSIQAPNFDPFNATLELGDPPYLVASQQSTITASLFTGSGVAHGKGHYDGGNKVGEYLGDSIFFATFSVTEPTEYNLTGSVSSNFPIPMSASVTVQGASGSITFYTDFGNPLVEFDHIAILSPGMYNVKAIAHADATLGTEQMTSSFNFQFKPVPSPGASLVTLALAGMAARRRRQSR